ncbi:receptor kinase-like protein Xa21 [Capsicum galapagoense]
MPTSLLNCSQLQTLSLSYNEFDGPIHSEIGRLSNLQFLYLGFNHFKGEIPKEISNLVELEKLDLLVNSFSGSLDMEIFNISGLRIIDLSLNNLSGSLPPNIDSILPNIEELYLANLTNLVGTIPHSISNCSKLTILELSVNQLTGLISNSLGYLTHLQLLNLAVNNLTSDSSLSFLTSLTYRRNLTDLGISFNPLNGMLPASIGNLSTSLIRFYANSCKVKGRIPNDFWNLSSLLDLDLSENNLAGSIPTTIGNLRNIQRLSFSNNELIGFSRDHICKLQHLGAIYLGQNQLSGSLPNCLGNITLLREIHLGSNELSSNIPSSLWNIEDIMVLDLSSNNMVGSLPPEIGNLKATILIDLSMNQFSNEIPIEIGGLQNLANLSLRHKKLQGAIPDSMSNMIGLEFLDLSHNYISGIIPKSMEKLQNLKYFNVSVNKLYGEIPSGGPFKNLSSQFFIYNEALCGSSRFSAPPCPTLSMNKSNSKRLLVLFLLLGLAILFVPIIFVFLWIRYRRGKRAPQQADSLSTITRERISYYELLQATDALSQSNLIGSGSFGSIYKGVLRSATAIAVKVLCHRNLIKVITRCSNLDFKALVLEYMPNGSIEKYLYSHNYFLDIRQRLSIMIDVACALEYFHHGCSFPVIHCDLKPSNDLLDEDMVAHLSDFGISKLLGEDESDLYTKTLATLGYIVPEYGQDGLVSTLQHFRLLATLILDYTCKVFKDDEGKESSVFYGSVWRIYTTHDETQGEGIRQNCAEPSLVDFHRLSVGVSNLCNRGLICSATEITFVHIAPMWALYLGLLYVGSLVVLLVYSIMYGLTTKESNWLGATTSAAVIILDWNLGACLYGFKHLKSRVVVLYVACTSRAFLIYFGVHYWYFGHCISYPVVESVLLRAAVSRHLSVTDPLATTRDTLQSIVIRLREGFRRKDQNSSASSSEGCGSSVKRSSSADAGHLGNATEPCTGDGCAWNNIEGINSDKSIDSGRPSLALRSSSCRSIVRKTEVGSSYVYRNLEQNSSLVVCSSSGLESQGGDSSTSTSANQQILHLNLALAFQEKLSDPRITSNVKAERETY